MDAISNDKMKNARRIPEVSSAVHRWKNHRTAMTWSFLTNQSQNQLNMWPPTVAHTNWWMFLFLWVFLDEGWRLQVTTL